MTWVSRIALVLAVGLFVLRGLRPWRRWLRLDLYAVVLLAAFAFAFAELGRSAPRMLALPLVALLGALLGVQSAPVRLKLGLSALTAASVIVIARAFTVAPLSPAPSMANTAPGRQGTSVLLVVMDNLRRDHLSVYGYPRRTTPRIDAWAKSARVFDRATSTGCWTLPSHASMFTGLYPRSHGAHGFINRAPANPKEHTRVSLQSAYPLREEIETLAEAARAAGVRTGGIVANHHVLGPTFGLGQGFETYQVLRSVRGATFGALDQAISRFDPYRIQDIRWPFVRAPFVTDQAIDWLRRHGGDQHFLFVNYMDVHKPTDQRPNATVPMGDEKLADDYEEHVYAGQDIEPRTKRTLINRYDRGLMVLDRELGRLFDFLESSGRAKDTLVILTSDHGEYFGEHQLVGHITHVYNEVTNVPLLLRGPGIVAGRDATPSSSVDVYSTTLAALGLPIPSSAQGQVLPVAQPRPVFSEWYPSPERRLLEPRFKGRFDRRVAAVNTGDLRLIRYEDGQSELYDLQHDPRELRDLAGARPNDVARLGDELRRFETDYPAASRSHATPVDATPLSDHELRQIRALGYAQ